MPNLKWMAIMTTLSLSLASGGQEPTAPTIPTGFLCKTITLEGEAYAYVVYVPPEYKPDKPWPVILYLHGSGERGSDGLFQTEIGLGRAIRRNRARFPAIVVMPQCRKEQSWVGPMGDMALRCLEQTSREYALDPQRIYLTGLSLGGQGTWHLAAMLPDRFAAVVPVCGFAEWGDEQTGIAQKLAERLTKVPIWCFHGDADPAVPVEKSRELVAAVRERGGNVIYTEYPGAKHNVWDQAYGDADLWKWVFEKKLLSDLQNKAGS